MGPRTAQAEVRVIEQRARISKMLEELEHRVQDDVDGVRGDVSARISGISDRASGIAQRVPGADALTQQVSVHPFASALGGFATGVALGMTGETAGGDEDDGQPARKAEAHSRHNGGASSRLFDVLSSATMGVVAGPLREEMQTLVRQAASGFLGTGASRGEGASATSAADRSPSPELSGNDRSASASSD